MGFFLGDIKKTDIFDENATSFGKVKDFVLSMQFNKPINIVGIVCDGHPDIFIHAKDIINFNKDAIVVKNKKYNKFEKRSGENLFFEDIYETDFQGGKINDLKTDEKDFAYISCISVAHKDGSQSLVNFKGVLNGDQYESARLLAEISELSPNDAARKILNMPQLKRDLLLEEISKEFVADIFEELDDNTKIEFANIINDDLLSLIINRMQPDDATDLLHLMPQNKRLALLKKIDTEKADTIKTLLKYDTKSAGGLMTTDAVIVSPQNTVAEALALIRNREIAPATAAIVWIANPPKIGEGDYLGMVHFQALLRSRPSQTINSLIDKKQGINALSAKSSLQKITKFMAQDNLTAAPVVSNENKLLGVVTVDDILDALLPKNWRTQKIKE